MTTRRYQSGEMDYSGRISKHGDAMVRSLLYEAANCMLTTGEPFRWPEKNDAATA